MKAYQKILSFVWLLALAACQKDENAWLDYTGAWNAFSDKTYLDPVYSLTYFYDQGIELSQDQVFYSRRFDYKDESWKTEDEGMGSWMIENGTLVLTFDQPGFPEMKYLIKDISTDKMTFESLTSQVEIYLIRSISQ